MYNQHIWQLPTSCRTENIRSRLSWDGQIYYACKNCSREIRFDPVRVNLENDQIEIECTNCNTTTAYLVRHLNHQVNLCKDCNQTSKTEITLFDEVKCPYCLSINLRTLSSSINPSYPPLFQDFFYGRIWGQSEEEDVKILFEQYRIFAFEQQYPLYLLLSIALGKRLLKSNNYNSPKKFPEILNFEGLWLREYFRLTGEIFAGIESVNVLEKCVNSIEEPYQQSLIEYNVAISIYSLLSRYSEDIVCSFTERPEIRIDAIKIAKKALETLKKKILKNSFNTNFWLNFETIIEEGAQVQLARYNFIIGDLLKIGNASQTQVRQSIQYLNQSEEYLKQISSQADYIKRLLFGIHSSRGTAISLLDIKSEEILKKGIEDLEHVLSVDDENRAWSEKIYPLYNLANFYMENGQDEKAKPVLEKSVGIAMYEINNSFCDEQILLQKTNSYIKVFESLSVYYVKRGYLEEALNILESIKLASLRFGMLSPTNKAKRQAKSAYFTQMENMLFPISGKAKHSQIESIELKSIAPDLKKLVHYLNKIHTALICFIKYGLNFTSIAIVPSTTSGYQIYSKQWKPKISLLKNMRSMMLLLDPSPLREKRLKRLCESGYNSFLHPLVDFLQEKKVKRIAVSTQPLFSSLPFEAFYESTILPSSYSNNQFDTFYLPSLSLGFDLLNLKPRFHENKKLLIVGYLDEDLKYTQQELDCITKLWGNRVTRLEGSKCSKKYVLNELEGEYDYIHFSCHGTFNPIEPLKSALHLVSNSQKDSHRIMARDILKIKFKYAPVITMSACSSALTCSLSSSDYIGLTGSLFRAGARAIIASRWPVYDDTSAIFSESLYSKFYRSSDSPFLSFRKTQLEMQSKYGIEDWAAFGYFGLP